MARSYVSSPTKEILEAALVGLEAQKEKLDEQIAHVRKMLGGGRSASTRKASGASAEVSEKGTTRKKRVLSPEARKRIAAAQKKRWANFRKSQQG